MTITIGWWLLPLSITLASFAWAILTPARKGGDYSVDLFPLFRFAAAVIVSLAAWLVWALLT